jgi:hypothetical protein
MRGMRKNSTGSGSKSTPQRKLAPLIFAEDTVCGDPWCPTGFVACLVNSKCAGTRDHEGVRITELPDWKKVPAGIGYGRNICRSKVQDRASTFETLGNIEGFRRETRSFQHERD